MEVAASITLLTEPTRAELRETTLNYNPFSAPGSSSSTPRSPDPLLGPSPDHDAEAAVDQGQIILRMSWAYPLLTDTRHGEETLYTPEGSNLEF